MTSSADQAALPATVDYTIRIVSAAHANRVTGIEIRRHDQRIIAISDGGTMLQRGDLVPHFTVKTLHGDEFSYLTIWQRKNLVLIALPVTDSESARSYASELAARGADFDASEADCVITQDRIQAIPGPAVLLADQWGEVVFIAATSDVRDLPQVEEVLQWVHYVKTRCPECEGESK